MPHGYWIVHLTVSDQEAYQDYRKLVVGVLAGFGGRLIVRGAPQDVIEGKMRSRTIVVEFPDLAAAKACYASSEYQKILPLRTRCAVADLCIIEGSDAA
jgi:uncharacterized protein (DUF1330 family)